MELFDKIPEIIKFISDEATRIERAKNKLTIYEGELLPFVETALRNELSSSAFERARKRIAPINFLPKVINKLSTLYNAGITRTLKTENDSNKDILDYYVESLNVNNSGRISNQQTNLNKYSAWEIYISGDNTPKLRILPAHQFLVYSDDIEDPTHPTVFIKLLGFFNKDTGLIDENTERRITRNVAIYKLFTNDEILVVDSDGEIRSEFMQQNPEGVNPYGVIPFVYIRKSDHSLLPYEDTSDIPMITLIPLLLTDLNYATQFMSHSIIYAIDAELNNPSGNPDSIWMIKSDINPDGETTSSAKIGTIKPEVDIDKVITLIQTQLALWLDSKDIKAQSVGSLESSNLASGISKMIDEGDTTQSIKTQMEVYRKAEYELFEKLGIIHNVWVDQGLLSGTEINKRVIDTLEVNTSFEEPAVIVNEKERLETIMIKEEAGYTSHKRAIMEANPDLDTSELDQLNEEIEEEGNMNRTFTLLSDEDEEESNTEVNTGEAVDQETLKELSLNGAQVTALIKVVEEFKRGTLDREGAIALITTAFPIEETKANDILGEDNGLITEEEETNLQEEN